MDYVTPTSNLSRIVWAKVLSVLGTLIALFLLQAAVSCTRAGPVHGIWSHGGIIRGDTTVAELALIFTGGDFADGGRHIAGVLRQQRVKAGFFFTGDFYRTSQNAELIHELIADGHYLGPHSDRHLLYCPWDHRDSLLVTREEFVADMQANYDELARFDLDPRTAPWFIPPFEWYNDSISTWARREGWILFNHTPGTLSAADYTTPSMPNYRSSDRIWDSIIELDRQSPVGLNGFILLIHIGTDPARVDKFYFRLDSLIRYLRESGYRLVRIDDLLKLVELPGPS